MYKWKEVYAHLTGNGVVVNFNEKGDKAFAHVPLPGGGKPDLTETIHLHGKGELEQIEVDKICKHLGIPKMQ
jgi:hypothetical protein